MANSTITSPKLSFYCHHYKTFKNFIYLFIRWANVNGSLAKFLSCMLHGRCLFSQSVTLIDYFDIVKKLIMFINNIHLRCYTGHLGRNRHTHLSQSFE